MGAFTAVASSIADIGNQFAEARLQDRAERLAIDRYNQERIHTVGQDFWKRRMAEAELANAGRALDLQQKGMDINARWQDIQGWRAVGSPVRMGDKWVQRYQNIATGATKDYDLPGAPETHPEQQWNTLYNVLSDMAKRRGVTVDKLTDTDRTQAFVSVFGREPSRAPRTDAQEFQDLATMANEGLRSTDPAIAAQWRQLLGKKGPVEWAREQWLFRNAGYGIRAAMPGQPGWQRSGGSNRTGEASEFGLDAGEKRMFDVQTAMHRNALQSIRTQQMATIDPMAQQMLAQREEAILQQIGAIAQTIINQRPRVPGQAGQPGQPGLALPPVGALIPFPPGMDAEDRLQWSKAKPGDKASIEINGITVTFEKQSSGAAKRIK